MSGERTHEDRLAREMLASRSMQRDFEDPDAFAAAIPGGRFGVLPYDDAAFRARARLSNLSDGLTEGAVVRAVRAAGPVSMRSEFIGSPQGITFLFAADPAPPARLDGRTLGDGLVMRRPGDTPHLRTWGETEMVAVVLFRDMLQRAAAALTGRELARLRDGPASAAGVDPVRMRALRRTNRDIARAMREPAVARAPSGALLMRRRLVADLVEALQTDALRRDHLATRLQTASMARIERHIDETRDSPGGLQDLCEATGLALRTVETIVKRRTGVSAHAYLARRRLAFARAALLAPSGETSVTRLAMHHGFFHLGRFAGFYRQVYGERPSDTLRRSLGRAAED
ncbi:MAG: helix-turn-helix domain-containing protein [Pseudomonadota bacterium]|nr:helix-turn-helix domain-containing protein [Pseudomonadota bacterium]